jgi:hypothetical protein
MTPAQPNGLIWLRTPFVAFVMAENTSEAMAAGQVQAAEGGSGPNEPINWAVVFMAEWHHRNANDDPDEA